MNLCWRWFWTRKLGLPDPKEIHSESVPIAIPPGVTVFLPAHAGLAVHYEGAASETIFVNDAGVVQIIDSNGARWIIKAVNS